MTERARAIRFTPPPVLFSPELRWALLRAFAPPDEPCPGEMDGTAALHVADRLDLTHRIGARQPAALLHRELGPRLAGRVFARHEAVRRWAQGLAALSERVAAKAAQLNIPVVALKFLALRLEGVAPDGLRRAGDLDLLVPAAETKRLAEGLGQIGLRELDFPPEEHALALADDDGRGVEIHWHVPGVSTDPEGRPASFEDLEREGLLQAPAASGFLLARRDVLVAHLATHGLVHHGGNPDAYPILRMVCDLADLGIEPGAPVLEGAHRWTASQMEREELEALARLVVRLRSADPTLLAEAAAADPEGLLLRHFLAGALDSDYQASLRLRSFRESIRKTSLLRQVLRAAWPTNAQLDLLYGPAETPTTRLLQHLRRPFDLLGRLLRYAAATARLKRQAPETGTDQTRTD